AYQGAARNAVLTLKFRSGRYLAPLMSELLRRELDARPLQADVLVAVPLSPSRLRIRGFNQAALLAEQLGVASVVDALARRERPPQSSLKAAERLVNLRDAFTCVQADAIMGKRIL